MNRWNGCLGISAVIFLAVFLSTVLLAGNGHGNPVVDGTPGAVPPCMADEVVESRIPVSPRVIDDAVGTRHAVSPRATVEVAESQTPMSPHSQPTQSPNADKPSPQILDTQSQTQNPPLNPPSAGNTPADHPEIVQKMQKLQMPFIANEGQVDECVAFYAKTFGGTVFVTKNGEIVYSLPSGRDVPAGASQESCRDTARRVPTSPIQYLAYVMHSSKGDVLGRIPEKRESRIMDYVSWFGGCAPDGRLMGLPVTDSTRGRDTVPRVPTVNLFDDTAGRVAATAARRDTVCRVPARSTGVALKEEFIGAKISGIKGEGESVTKVSYFKGNDPSKWKSNISTYQLVNLGEIYEGVELKLKAHGNNVEKLLYVKPGADIEQIKIRLSGIQPAETPMMEGKQPPESPFIKGNCAESTFDTGEGRRPGGDVSTKSPLKKGARGLSVNEHGELEAETVSGTVAFTRPVAYQEINGKRVEVECAYTIAECGVQNAEFVNCGVRNSECGIGEKSQNPNSSPIPHSANSVSPIPHSTNSASPIPHSEYSFTVASYDKTKDLIIDPLLASTFLGGNSYESGNSLTLDTSGNVYVTGFTGSSDFPTTSGAYDTSFNGDYYDIFVSKLNSGLTSLLASTFLGGSADDYGYSLTLDTSGNVYVTGETGSSDFPTTSGAYDTSYNGGYYNVFVSKLNSGLTGLLASTYLGGSGSDSGNSLVLDTSGNVYVTGDTGSSDFPTTSGAYDTSYNGGEYGDVFVSKLDGGLTGLLASTYLGGSGSDSGNSLTLDTSGNVYVTGWTASTNFPTTSGAYDTSYNGGGGVHVVGDVFVSKLDGGLTSLLVSTYLGGSGSDLGNSLTIDTSGNVYVTGGTDSTNFPTTSGAYDTSFNGGGAYYAGDVFVSKLNSGLTSLLVSTYLGGSSYEDGNSLTLDTSGNVYVAGWTWSTDFPTTSGAYDTFLGGWEDVFISKLNSGLTSLLVSTYLGGSSYDSGNSMTLDTSGNVYVAGSTGSGDFPTTSGAYDTSYNGGDDVFVSKLDGNLSAGTGTAQAPTVTTGDAADITLNGATLKGVVNAHGLTATAWFDYGDTSGGPYSHTNTQTVTGSSDTPISAALTGLSGGTKYYYRIVAENNVGKTEGGEKTFTTNTATYELLAKYAPILYMHEDELYYPMKVEVMLENAELWKKYKLSCRLVDSTPSLGELMTKEYDRDSHYLRLKTDWNKDRDSDFWKKYPTVYGRKSIDGDSTVLQYWFFYIYNDWDNVHEGDWEMIQIVLNKKKEPIGITYSIHLGGLPLHWNDPDVSKDTDDSNHPLVYVTKGGHGSWNRPGDNVWYQDLKRVTCAKCIDKTSDAGDVLYPDTSPYGSKGEKYTLVDVDGSEGANSEYHWIHWLGYWGDQLYITTANNGEFAKAVKLKVAGPDSPPYIDYINKKCKGKKSNKGRWFKPIKWSLSPNPPGYIICVSANTRIAMHGLDDSALIPISEHCETVLKSCGECSDIKVVYTGKDLVFDMYSLDGKEVEVRISRRKMTGEVYEVEFNGLEIPKEGLASFTFSPEQNPHLEIALYRNLDGVIDSHRLPDSIVIE